MNIISGFEPTRIIGRDKGMSVMNDVLENSLHLFKYKEDLALVKDVGIKTLRVAVPWHRIEEVRYVYNWEWMDDYMEELRGLGIDAILDPLHHMSIPSWLKKGFLDDMFAVAYIEFFESLVERYPWVNKYTIINEPVVTTIFSCREGVWYPFYEGVDNFQKGLQNVENVILFLSHYLQEKGKEHWYVDSAEYHRGFCESSSCHASDMNNVRFLLLDRLVAKNVYITVLGLDYYTHCEFEWEESGRRENQCPVGFYNIAKQYVERYNLPIALTETNIRGYITDRQTWFVHMYKQCLQLEQEYDFRGFCWYPFKDPTDWDSLVTQSNRNIDPQGIIWVDEEFNSHTSEFSDSVKKLIAGEITIDDFKTYNYLAPLDEHLKGFTNAPIVQLDRTSLF